MLKKEDLVIGSVNDFDYDTNTGKLSFNITTKTAIYMEANSSFGGKEVDFNGTQQWLERRSSTDTHKVIDQHLKYSSSDIDKDSELGKTMLKELNKAFPASTPIFTELTDDHIFVSSEIEDMGIKPIVINGFVGFNISYINLSLFLFSFLSVLRLQFR